MNNLTIRITVILFVLLAKNAVGQNPGADSTEYIAYNKTVADFNTSINRQSLLYNGREYRFYPNSINGNAYFDNINTWQTGSVTYDGFYYENVKLMYDVSIDAAVVMFYNGYSMFILKADKLDNFSMGSDRFINIHPGNAPAGVTPGIYHTLYQGKLQILAKQEKSLQPSPSNTEYYFKYSKSFLIRKDDTYYRITSEGSALNVLKDKKKELKQVLKQNQVRYRKNPEKAMMLISTEYDRLTN